MNFFDDAITSHLEWKVRLIDSLERTPGEINRPTDDDSCELSRWLAGEGLAYREFSEYGELVEAHSMFHRSAAAIIDIATRGDIEQARALLSPERAFAEASSLTVIRIGNLRTAIERAKTRGE